MTPAELTGQLDGHITQLESPACGLHRDAVAAFLSLRRAAGEAGIDLTPVSSFRPFERQLGIWNGKFRGERPVLDQAGAPLDVAALDDGQRVDAILQWSALPGASRHHWGTDLDVIDRAAMAADYRVELVAREFAAGGPFAALTRWLDANALHYGFFRPYRGLSSGVQAEPWHLSFAPLADGARRQLTVRVLEDALQAAPLLGKAVVLERLPELHRRYVEAIDYP